MRVSALIAFLLASLPWAVTGQELRLPNREGSVKFAIIGDSGQPGSGQTAVVSPRRSLRLAAGCDQRAEVRRKRNGGFSASPRDRPRTIAGVPRRASAAAGAGTKRI